MSAVARLPSVPEPAPRARKTARPLHVDTVDEAIGEVLQGHPEYFDFTNTAPMTNSPFILKADGCIAGVQAVLTRRGLCPYHDGESVRQHLHLRRFSRRKKRQRCVLQRSGRASARPSRSRTSRKLPSRGATRARG